MFSSPFCANCSPPLSHSLAGRPPSTYLPIPGGQKARTDTKAKGSGCLDLNVTVWVTDAILIFGLVTPCVSLPPATILTNSPEADICPKPFRG